MSAENPDVLLVASNRMYDQLRKRWFGALDDLGIARITLRDAPGRFRFELGHPTDGAAYVQHPFRPGYYLVPARANERMAQEKLAAFTQIASALGARRVELVSAEVAKNAREGGLQLPVLARTLGISAVVTREGSVERHVHAEFEEPVKRPYFPEEHRHWLDMDPILKSLVQIRMNDRPTSYKVALALTDVFERGTKLDVQLGKLGISVGGRGSSIGRSTWHFHVEFWPVQKASASAAVTTVRESPAVIANPRPRQASAASSPRRAAEPPFRRRRLGVGVWLLAAAAALSIVAVAVTLIVTRSSSQPSRNAPTAQAAVDYEEHMTTGSVLQKQRRWREAFEAYELALAAKPDDFRALAEVGWTASHCDELARGRVASKRAVELAPTDIDRAMALNSLGRATEPIDRDAAIAHYERSLSLRENATVRRSLEKLQAIEAP